LRKLAAGEITTNNNASMSLARGMSCEAAFIVNAPLDTTYRALLGYNPVRHPELETFQHHVFRDEKDAAFDKLRLDPKVSASAATIRAMGDAGEFQLAKREGPLPKTRSADAAQQFLTGILRDRWAKFSR